MPKKKSDVDVKMGDLIARTAEFVCKENQYGAWSGAPQINARCLWGVANCGLAYKDKDFITASVVNLFENCKKSEYGRSWNDEVWDTTLCAIAIMQASGDDFENRLKDVRRWLLSQYSELEKNFYNEPWESLYALITLLDMGMVLKKLSVNEIRIIKSCTSWILSKRTGEGVLISPHYSSLLLAVLGRMLHSVRLTQEERSLYEDAVKKCVAYIFDDYQAKKKVGALWSNEAWNIGIILYGLAATFEWTSRKFDEPDFSSFLVNWCETEWDPSRGWSGNVGDASELLAGVSEYYIAKMGKSRPRKDVQQELAAKVDFKFRPRRQQRMTVHPIWKTRNFRIKRRTCCILMPFSKRWSNKIYNLLKTILKDIGYLAVRPDELYDREVLEGIWKAINEAQIIIAVCSGKNLNVYYELGISQTVGKDVILLTDNMKNIPYDLQSQRVIEFKSTDAPQTLKMKIEQTIDYIKAGRI